MMLSRLLIALIRPLQGCLYLIRVLRTRWNKHKRMKALRELTRLSQELGLYDDDGYNPLIKTGPIEAQKSNKDGTKDI